MKATTVYPEDMQPIARAVDAFVEQAVRSDAGSMFTPGVPIWSTANLTELKQRFADRPDLSSAGFDEKIAKQLSGASDAALQLMAEILYVYYMIAYQMRAKTKLENVQRILGWMKQKVEVPADLVAAADQGLTNTGTFYLTNKPYQLWFIINAGLAWRQRSQAERESLLADPWAFKAFMMKVPDTRAAPIRMALLHFVFPDTFEIIISAAHKRQICAAFPGVSPDEPDEDRRLLAIKATLPPQPRDVYVFYGKDVLALWEPKKKDVPATTTRQERPKEPSPGLAPPVTMMAIAESLFVDVGWLTQVRDVLLERGQIVLYGPPGTGKTRIARELASSLAPPERVHFVQFHPAYSYEDFIEGLRPKVGGGLAQFEVRPGPLRRIASAAAANPDDQFVLVIDEINRANLARVLGELVFLLEYRDTAVTLPYSGEQLSLPHNVLIIGTMNTADRSIALIDAAIRRRFAFFRLAPDCAPVEGLLADWLDANAREMGWVDELVNTANEIIQSPDHAIGPTFFMRPGLDEAMLNRIWKWQVLPYLDEFLYDAPETRRKLDLGHLRGLIGRSDG